MHKIKVSLIDLVALIDSVSKGAAHEEIGFEDADRTLETLLSSLNKHVMVDKEAIESALWSASYLSRAGEFKHPLNTPFHTMLNRIVPEGMTYDEFFHIIESSKKVGL